MAASNASAPVGVFDSGMGGLTVLHECLVSLPHEDFVYLGDGARCPYGPRPREEIQRFSHEIAAYLQDAGVKLIVAACNSATSAALPELQLHLDVPVVGVLTPEAHAAVQATRNRRIGLMATEAFFEAVDRIGGPGAQEFAPRIRPAILHCARHVDGPRRNQSDEHVLIDGQFAGIVAILHEGPARCEQWRQDQHTAERPHPGRQDCARVQRRVQPRHDCRSRHRPARRREDARGRRARRRFRRA